ncbi:MAG TPA: TCR/Tet family MFS transporter [Candidatus Eisenbacteria bacterium]|nr:TCR/Tet family MFS transporter [Candidatus Eisenbacteria bacterium]
MREKATQNEGRGGTPAASRATFLFIIITVALDFLAFGIIAPVLPNLIVQFEGGNMARASQVTGYFAFAWAAMQFLFSPLLGAWSDRFGRRPIILISCLGLGLDYIVMALAPTLRWLFLGRIISGITTSNVSTAFAYIADVTTPAERAKKYGLLGAAFGLGFVIGPAVGGLLGHYSLRAPFWAAAGLSLVNFLYGIFVLPESLPVEKRAKSAWQMANPLGSLALLRSNSVLSGLSVVATLYYLAHQALPSVFVLYTEYRYGWNERTVGLVLGMIGICIASVSGGLVGPYVKKFGERWSLASGLFFGTLGFAGFAAASQSWALLAAIPFIALWGVSGPSMQSLMSQMVDPSSQGKLQGAINSLRALTGMAGPLLFTQVFSEAIAPKARFYLPGAPYFLGAILLAGSLLLTVVVTRGLAVRKTEQPA